MEDEILVQLAQFMVEQTKEVLSQQIPSRSFVGQNKPLAGQFPTPYSPKIASGKFINSIAYRIDQDPDDNQPYITIYSTLPESEDPGKFIRDGRPNFARFPNIEAIQRWIRDKQIRPQPLPQRNRDGEIIFKTPSLKQLTYLISRGIARDGVFPYPYESLVRNKVIGEVKRRMEGFARDMTERLIQERVIFIVNRERRVP